MFTIIVTDVRTKQFSNGVERNILNQLRKVFATNVTNVNTKQVSSVVERNILNQLRKVSATNVTNVKKKQMGKKIVGDMGSSAMRGKKERSWA